MDATLKRLRAAYLAPAILAAGGVLWGLVLARFSFPNVLMLIALSVAAVGSIIEPLVGVGVALFLGPFWAWLPIAVPQVPPLIGQYVFLLAVAAWIARGLMRRSLRIPRPPLLLPLLLFMGVTLLSLWNPIDEWVGWWEWAKWGQILLMALLVYDRLLEHGGTARSNWLMVMLALPAVFQAAVGLWQSVWWGGAPANFAINDRFFRAYGTFQQPNPYAGFLGMIGALLIGPLLVIGWEWISQKSKVESRKSKPHAPVVETTDCYEKCVRNALDAPPRDWFLTRFNGFSISACEFIRRLTRRGLYGTNPNPKWLLLPAVALIGVGIVASWSRGAWMGFGIALLTMAAALPKRGAWGVVLALALVGGGLGLYSAGLLPASIAGRLTGFLEYTRFEDVRGAGINDANFAVLERMAHWQAALDMWRANFWFGVGFGGYDAAYLEYRLINWELALGHAHNYYLNLLAETGVTGLAAYLLFLGSVFWGLWRASHRLDGWERGLALGLIGAWMHMAAHDLVDNILVNNVHLHLGVLLALSAWVMRVASEEWRVRS